MPGSDRPRPGPPSRAVTWADDRSRLGKDNHRDPRSREGFTAKSPVSRESDRSPRHNQHDAGYVGPDDSRIRTADHSNSSTNLTRKRRREHSPEPSHNADRHPSRSDGGPSVDRAGSASPTRTSGSSSEDKEFIALLDRLHSRTYWLAKRQDASEKIKSIKADIGRLDVGLPGHASQSEIFKAHLKVYDPEFKKASERVREVDQVLLAHRQDVLNLLHKPSAALLPNEAVSNSSPSDPSNVEQCLEALERGHRKDVDELRENLARQQESLKSYGETSKSQQSQIRILETKLGAESARSTEQESKIRKLEEKLSQANQKLTETCENLNNLGKRLEENRRPAASGHAQGNVPNELKSQIENLQGLAKTQEKKSKDMEFELDRQKEQHKTLSVWKENLQKGQRLFATKEDIRTCTARQQTDIAKATSQIEATTTSVNKLWELESKRTQKPTADQSVAEEHLSQGLATMKTQIEDLKSGLSKIVEDELHVRFEKVETLLPRLEHLENSTLKTESLGDIKVEDLRAICKRDFDASIRDEVQRRVAALPVPDRQAQAQPTTIQPHTESDRANIVATVKYEVKEEIKQDMQPVLSKMSEGIGAFIDAERQERKRIQVAQGTLRQDVDKFIFQLQEVEKAVGQQPQQDGSSGNGRDAQITSMVDGKVEEIRTWFWGQMTHDKSALVAQISDLQKQREVSVTEHQSVLERLSAQDTAINSTQANLAERFRQLDHFLGTLTPRNEFDNLFGQLQHEISCLNAFQANFSTKDIYSHLVRYMQELVPGGTHAALKSFDIRLHRLEGSVAGAGAPSEMPNPVSGVVPVQQQHMTNGFTQHQHQHQQRA